MNALALFFMVVGALCVLHFLTSEEDNWGELLSAFALFLIAVTLAS